MKVILTAGGGGHFAPLLSVIEKLPKDVSYVIVGRKYTFEGSKTLSLEYLTAQKRNLPFISITTGRLQRTLTKYSLVSLLKTPVGLYQARTILKKERPDVVMSFGGYISVPVVLAAASLRIPVIIHEQTRHAGLANKLAAKFAQKICISWNSSKKDFPARKTILTGNPVKKEMEKVIKTKKKKLSPSLPMILITGGSQGAHNINVLVEHSLAALLAIGQVLHLTGDSHFHDFERLKELKDKLPAELKNRYTLKKFLEPEEMLSYLTSADLIISRSGINTSTELLLLEKPTLVIPLMHGQTDEQVENAKLLKDSGIGEIVFEKNATTELFCKKIEYMLSHLAEYSLKNDLPEIRLHLTAAQTIADLIVYVGNQTTNKTS